jgi:hypothetical protein
MTIEDANTEVENLEEEVQENDDAVQDEDQNQEEADQEDEEGPLVVSIGDDEPDDDDDLTVEREDDTDTIKKMRAAFKKNKADAKAKEARLKELEAKEVERLAAKEQKELRPKPLFDDYGHGEEDKFEDDLIGWHEDKKKFEAKKNEAKEKEDAVQNSYNENLEGYNTRKKALAVEDYDDVETKVSTKLSTQQMQLAVHGLEKPELLFVALSRNSKELERLSNITDPTKYAVAIGKIEAQLKTSKGNRAPDPEKRLKGKAAIVSGDKALDDLEKEAARTGDRTKVIAYNRGLRKSA